MLYDAEFLKRLDQNRTKTTFARIIALQLDETPIETIEGRVTQGSINLDGASSVRRTCSLTIVAQDFDYNNFLWGLNTKFKLEIGLENNIDPTYPNIIWFKQGTYFISSFNTSRSTNNFTITIQGKDKMCGLNGEVGGTFTSSVDVGTMEDIDTNGNRRIIRLPLKDIIRNVVQMYGNEPAHNIIINDLDMDGLELIEYRYDEPMYLYRDATVEGSEYANITLDGKKPCRVNGIDKTLDTLTTRELEMLVSPMTGSKQASKVNIEGNDYYVAKISFGETAGYRYTDLTYPGDLIAGIGESVTSILDKIKNMLGEFEYFYNLDGQFVFQKKKTYVNTRWSPEEEDSDGKKYISTDDEIAYTFNNGTLITAFNNNPNIQNLRNDFSVWGQRTGVSGAAISVHMRYAIDRKPMSYTSIFVNADNQEVELYNQKYGTNISGQNSITYLASDYDWREVIYRMAQDYYKYAHILSDFETRLVQTNPEFTSGKTGYENYYIDLISYWRDLYDPETAQKLSTDIGIAKIQKFQYSNDIKRIKNILIADDTLTEEQKKTYQEELNATKVLLKETEQFISNSSQKLITFKDNYYYNKGEPIHWNRTVYEAPQNLNFWFDFLDNGELQQYNVKSVGCRPKSINDSNVKAIYFRETPNILFMQPGQEKKSGSYTYINIPPAYVNTMFSISAQGRCAKDKIDELLYTHSYCTESATITTIPIYYLEPNVKVRIIDKQTNLDGYYEISKLSIPLAYNGTMSVTATKVANEI